MSETIYINKNQFNVVKGDLMDINRALALFIEWFCSLDAIIYSSRTLLYKSLIDKEKANKKGEIPYIGYKKDFSCEYDDNFGPTIQIRVYLNKYLDNPEVELGEKENNIIINYNIKYFNYPDMMPCTEMTEEAFEKIFAIMAATYSEDTRIRKNVDIKDIRKWYKFNSVYNDIELYRFAMLMQFANTFIFLYGTDFMYNVIEKGMANEKDPKVFIYDLQKYAYSKVRDLCLFYNEIASSNTEPGYASIYYTIKTIEKEMSYHSHDNEDIFSKFEKCKDYFNAKHYLWHKNLYFMRKYMTETDKCSINLKSSTKKDVRNKQVAISHINDELIYRLIVCGERLTLFSGIET